jgi:hypothetical protein
VTWRVYAVNRFETRLSYAASYGSVG